MVEYAGGEVKREGRIVPEGKFDSRGFRKDMVSLVNIENLLPMTIEITNSKHKK